MKRYWHLLAIWWWDFRIWLLVQRIRVWGTLRGKPSLWGYSWRAIAAEMARMKLVLDRSAGVEPSSKHIDVVRDMTNRSRG
jgi:hypothetical protein